MIDRLDRLVDRAPAPVAALIRARLGMDAFLVIAAVFVGLRLLNVYPWTASILGAYLYAPAFAQLIAPLTALSWPVFAAIWTAMIAAVYVWLVGRWAVPLLFTLAVALELFLGQIDVFLAAAIIVGFRYPAAWAFPILTKIAPGIGLIWFVVRKEWRNLALALATTIGIAAISAAFAPDLWRGWFDLIRRSLSEKQTVEGAFLAVPIWLRLPVGILLSMPILWVNVFTILIALLPLRGDVGLTPAREWLLRTQTLKPALAPAKPG